MAIYEPLSSHAYVCVCDTSSLTRYRSLESRFAILVLFLLYRKYIYNNRNCLFESFDVYIIPKMGLTTNLHSLNLRSTFFFFTNPLHCPTPFTSKLSSVSKPRREILNIRAQIPAIRSNSELESLFSSKDHDGKLIGKQSNNGASSISSGVRLENISKSYEGVTVLKDVTWEVKKGEKVGLIGVNGAGKTTQLRIITGQEEPDSGNVIRAKPNLKVAFLSQEFEVSMGKTVKEEFMSAFKEEMEVAMKLEKLQKAIEEAVDDLELMGRLLDEFDLLQRRAQEVDLDSVDAKISKLMSELGFVSEDADRLVASFSSGWQMRMSLGKILLQVIMRNVIPLILY